jgi:Zn-dependent protease with chaperone function
MADSAPTVLALQPDSAWVVILVVSAVSVPVVAALRRIIDRPGGHASALLVGLPLFLPLIAALLYGHPLLPEVAVLRPAVAALEPSGSDLGHLMLMRGRSAHLLIPYVVASSTGWLLLAAVGLSSVMVVRRLLGAAALRRLMASCRPLGPDDRALQDMVERLAREAGMKAAPVVQLLPGDARGSFTAGGRILVSVEVLNALEGSELEAVFAHEIAHVAVHDAGTLCVGGLLRDLAVWNPFAHIAFRRLRLDREVEADRRAAALTGKPLAVASSLLKMCELLGSGPQPEPAMAVGFWSRRSRLSRRVSSLLALADGRITAAPVSGLPFLAAAALAAVLALEVGARITQQSGALALVWGAPGSVKTRVWTPELDPWRVARETRDGRIGVLNRSKRTLDQPLPPQALVASLRAAPTVEERHLARWMRAMSRAIAGEGTPLSITQASGFRAQPLFPESAGFLGVYSVEPVALDPRPIRTQPERPEAQQ